MNFLPSERESIAVHEAGHAVMASVVGQPLRYVTLRPRDPRSAAHVVFETSVLRRAWKRGEWRDYVLISFAGIIAQDLFRDPPGNLEAQRRDLVQNDGRGDLTYARDILRATWDRHRKAPAWSATRIDPEGSPLSLATQAWEQTVHTTHAWVDAIAEVADRLLTSRRALPSSVVRDVVDGTDQRMGTLPLPEHQVRPWFLDHSRLQWTPASRRAKRDTGVAA